MNETPEGNSPLIDVYVSGQLTPNAPQLKSMRLSWSLFAQQPTGPEVTMLGVTGEGDYHSIVGPVLAKTTENTLLAFAEGRRDSIDDFGDMDIILRRSTDYGVAGATSTSCTGTETVR